MSRVHKKHTIQKSLSEVEKKTNVAYMLYQTHVS